MRVLGIDPGTMALGYGIVDEGEEGMSLVDCGVLTLSPKVTLEKRLLYIYEKLNELIAHYKPQEAAIEEPFVARNVHSALAIGRAQAIAMLAMANQGVSLYHYPPTLVRQQVARYGASDKAQIQEVVKIQLGLSHPPQPGDATDALAVAICHLRQSHLNRLIEKSHHKGGGSR